MKEEEVEKVRERFEEKLRQEGYSHESLERDEWGYIIVDVELMWGGFTAGYMLAEDADDIE